MQHGLDAARGVLERTFGYPRFRVHQLKVLGPLLSGRDVLAVLPTGAASGPRFPYLPCPAGDRGRLHQ